MIVLSNAKTLTTLSIIIGILGVISLILAWAASPEKPVLGLSETHLFYDSIALLLIAIWLKLGAIYHKK